FRHGEAPVRPADEKRPSPLPSAALTGSSEAFKHNQRAASHPFPAANPRIPCPLAGPPPHSNPINRPLSRRFSSLRVLINQAAPASSHARIFAVRLTDENFFSHNERK